jgi:DNA primase
MRKIVCDEAKKFDLFDYLSTLGHLPAKIRNQDYWYRSPLRDEKTPSFKVNRKSNLWYDHGTWQGGDLIDFGTLYHHWTNPDL